MKIRKFSFAILLVLLFSSVLCFALTAYSPDIYISVGPSLAFPSADYLKDSNEVSLPKVWVNLRSSADIDFLAAETEQLRFGIGVYAGYSSSSFKHNSLKLRDYPVLGAGLFAEKRVDEVWKIGLRCRLCGGCFAPYKTWFGEADFEGFGAMVFNSGKHVDSELVFALDTTVRKDIVHITPKVGYRLVFCSIAKGDN